MTGHIRFMALPVIISIVALLTFCGCQDKQTVVPGVQDDKPLTTQDEKAILLQQLDKKFENPDAHFQLGQIYAKEGLYDQARYHYNVAYGFDPSHRAVQAAIVKLLLDEKKETEAQSKAAAFMTQVDNSYDESLKLARAFKALNVDEYIMTSYQQVLRINPDSAEVYRDLGYYHLEKGDKDLAKSYLTKSFQLDSNQPDVAGELGKLGIEVQIPQPPEKKPGLWDRIFKNKETEQK